MATTTPTNAGALVVALDQIHVPGNVRALDQAHVDALAASIALQGLLVPVIVAAATDKLAAEGWRYQLIAGFHRCAAVAKLGHGGIDAIVRDVDGVESDRAVENIARKALNAYEPSTIALDASFGRSDDAIASGVWRFPALPLG
jgi:ParB/RepB/Spo0J family partition protein